MMSDILIDLWMPDLAKEWIKNWIKDDMVGIEFGSGCSTLWFGKNAKQLISIESNMEWYKRIKMLLKKHKIKNVKLFYATTKRQYLDILDSIKDGSVDFVLSDGPGELRSWCVISTWRKVKPGGIMIADDTQYRHSIGAINFMVTKNAERRIFKSAGTNPWNMRRNKQGWETSVWTRLN